MTEGPRKKEKKAHPLRFPTGDLDPTEAEAEDGVTADPTHDSPNPAESAHQKVEEGTRSTLTMTAIAIAIPMTAGPRHGREEAMTRLRTETPEDGDTPLRTTGGKGDQQGIVGREIGERVGIGRKLPSTGATRTRTLVGALPTHQTGGHNIGGVTMGEGEARAEVAVMRRAPRGDQAGIIGTEEGITTTATTREITTGANRGDRGMCQGESTRRTGKRTRHRVF